MAVAQRIDAATAVPPARTRSEWSQAWGRLRRNKAALVGGAILLFMIGVASFSELIAREPVNSFDPIHGLSAPTTEHWFGTDDLGRDVFTRVVRAAPVSLRVGVVAVALASVGGTLLGLVAGYFGGWVSGVIGRVLDIMLAFPGLLLALTIVAALGPGLQNAMVALGIAGIPYYARVVRGATLAAKELGYVRSARALGMRDTRIMLRHILPNIVSPVIVMATLGLGTSIIAAAGLSFLGLGATPPTAEWGLDLADSRLHLRAAPWIAFANGGALMITVLSINMLGDGLREALDPQADAWAT